jgi:EAL domain-containing protein (putative c-di-GMP-specific phosphodiesterase class I)
VNLSPRQFYQHDFIGRVERILREADLPASALDLEITESVLLERSDATMEMLNQLTEMGIKLAVDDFGTGYSSLAYLHRLPVSVLKIDQSFVSGIGQDSSETALVAGIIAMATSLQLTAIAEGVETFQQSAFLKSHGCLAAQGFYYSEPVPPAELYKMLGKPAKLTAAR